MKHSLLTFCLVSLLTGLSGPQAGLAQDPSVAAIQSRIEAWGYGDVKDLSRDRTGGWHAHVVRNNVEIAVAVDKGGRITAQPADKQLAARCNQLYAIASRSVSGGAGAEGSLGANMSVSAAGLDCHKGHYSAGIKTLETILDGQRISYPPS
jgi:hypothetical protein